MPSAFFDPHSPDYIAPQKAKSVAPLFSAHDRAHLKTLSNRIQYFSIIQ